jgi:hypothetical protein
VAPSDAGLPTASVSASGEDTPSESAAATAGSAPDAGDDTAGALPTWVVPAVLLALAAGGGAAYLVRQRRRTST